MKISQIVLHLTSSGDQPHISARTCSVHSLTIKPTGELSSSVSGCGAKARLSFSATAAKKILPTQSWTRVIPVLLTNSCERPRHDCAAAANDSNQDRNSALPDYEDVLCVLPKTPFTATFPQRRSERCGASAHVPCSTRCGEGERQLHCLTYKTGVATFSLELAKDKQKPH